MFKQIFKIYIHIGKHVFKLTNNDYSIILKRKIRSSFLKEKQKV